MKGLPLADRRRLRRRTAVLLLTVTAALALTAAVAHLAAASSAPLPRLGLSWSVVKRRCWTATTRTRVRRHGRLRIEKRRVRKCGQRPVRVHGQVLHLAWRQHGELFGRLTLSGKPIAGALVTIAWTIPNWQSGTAAVITGRNGRFSAYMPGPSKIITVSYQYAPGAVIAASRRIAARAWLSLHVGRLIAGHRARFYGALAGHYIPRDLYIQFWYWAGASGWQPFSHLAIVNPQTGRWATRIPIPPATAGYTYVIRATVVRSPDWPWAPTSSGTVVRYVS